MKTTVCLIRHGQTNWNKCYIIQGRYDKELNQDGINQIVTTAERLKSLNINVVNSIYYKEDKKEIINIKNLSPGTKANILMEYIVFKDTKVPLLIKKALTGNDNNIIVRDNLTERMFGIAEGLVICDDVYERILKDFYEGMESTEEIRKRAMNEILAIAKEYSGKNILITTHSHFIKGLFTAIDPQITFQSYLANGGLNFVEVEDGKIISHRFNQ